VGSAASSQSPGVTLAARVVLVRTTRRRSRAKPTTSIAARIQPGIQDKAARALALRCWSQALSSVCQPPLDMPGPVNANTTDSRPMATINRPLAALPSAGLATILPRVELVTLGAAQIARLLEMCADDAAARTHGPATVLGALLALSGAAPIPSGALGATGVGVLARATRLATPPRPAQRIRVRLTLAAVSTLLAIGPVLTVLLTASGVAMCGPVMG
jgi:hypothetical protein